MYGCMSGAIYPTSNWSSYAKPHRKSCGRPMMMPDLFWSKIFKVKVKKQTKWAKKEVYVYLLQQFKFYGYGVNWIDYAESFLSTKSFANRGEI